MSSIRNLAVIKALADPSRLMLLNAVLDTPHYVEELAERLKLAVSTVSFHLKKLEAAGLVTKTREQYYIMYTANPRALGITLRELVTSSAPDSEQLHQDRLSHYRKKVRSAFFKEGRLIQLPVQKKKRRIILEVFANRFKANRTYTEQAVNALIAPLFDDHCAIRRNLVEEGLLTRHKGVYCMVAANQTTGSCPQGVSRKYNDGKKETKMDRRTELKRRYKNNPPRSGIFRITNTVNGKAFIGKGMNVQGVLNGKQAQLNWDSHPNRELQQDWNRHGPEQFTCEVLDYLERVNDSQQDLQQELAALEVLWLEKLQPYGEKGYHKRAPKPATGQRISA